LENECYKIQLENDINLTVETLVKFIQDMFKTKEILCLTCKKGEILFPSLKIVEMILLDPFNYNELTVHTRTVPKMISLEHGKENNHISPSYERGTSMAYNQHNSKYDNNNFVNKLIKKEAKYAKKMDININENPSSIGIGGERKDYNLDYSSAIKNNRAEKNDIEKINDGKDGFYKNKFDDQMNANQYRYNPKYTGQYANKNFDECLSMTSQKEKEGAKEPSYSNLKEESTIEPNMASPNNKTFEKYEKYEKRPEKGLNYERLAYKETEKIQNIQENQENNFKINRCYSEKRNFRSKFSLIIR
jgi:hypothetical protein